MSNLHQSFVRNPAGKLRLVTIGVLLALLLFFMTAPDVASASSTTLTAPIHVLAKPKTITISCTNCDITITMIVKNKGTFSAIGTGCEYWYDGVKQTGCLFASKYFPFTLAPGDKATFKLVVKIGNIPAGTYTWKVVFIGTYNGMPAQSHSGTFTLIKTA